MDPTLTENFIFPRESSRYGTHVQTLPMPADLGMDDIEYFRTKVMRSTGLPASYIRAMQQLELVENAVALEQQTRKVFEIEVSGSPSEIAAKLKQIRDASRAAYDEKYVRARQYDRAMKIVHEF